MIILNIITNIVFISSLKMTSKKYKILFIIAALFFLVYKFSFTWLMWANRETPPEPTDTYMYVYHINSFTEGSFLEPNYTWFRVLYGGLKMITNLSGEIIFEANFYLGTVLLLIVLLFFLKYLNKSLFKGASILSLIILTFYFGHGSYQGWLFVFS